MGEAAFVTIRPYIERVLAGERIEYESEIPFRCGAESAFYRVVYVPDCDADGSSMVGLPAFRISRPASWLSADSLIAMRNWR